MSLALTENRYRMSANANGYRILPERIDRFSSSNFQDMGE